MDPQELRDARAKTTTESAPVDLDALIEALPPPPRVTTGAIPLHVETAPRRPLSIPPAIVLATRPGSLGAVIAVVLVALVITIDAVLVAI